MSRIIIFGTGTVARLAHYYFSNDTKYKVVAFTTDKKYIQGKKFLGFPVIDFKKIRHTYPPRKYKMFIAVGYANLNKVRAEKYHAAKKKKYELVSYISTRATIFDNTHIGDNCFILEDNTIQPFVTIGNNVTLWSGNHVGHDVTIENHCFITSHVVISGFTCVKKYSFVGVNATLRNGITVAEKNIIGAGAVIMNDTTKENVYVPPKSILLDRKSGEIRL